MKKINSLFLFFIILLNVGCKKNFTDHEKGGAIMLVFISAAVNKLQNEANLFFSDNIDNIDEKEESISIEDGSLSGKLNSNYANVTFNNYKIGNDIIVNGSIIIYRKNTQETVYNGEVTIHKFRYCSDIKYLNCILPTENIFDILLKIRGQVMIDGHRYRFRQIFSALVYYSINKKWD